MSKMNGSVVWITGAGSGIGRAVALECGAQGAAVALSGRRRDRLEAVAAEVVKAGGEALCLPCDVGEEQQIAEAVQAVVAWKGRLDVAWANAGFGVRGRIEELSGQDWERQLRVNLTGVALCARYCLPHLQRSRGRLALVSSAMAWMRSEKNGAYSASKAAVTAIGETLILELHGTGVSCTVIHPGFVESEIGQVDNEGRFDSQRRDHRPERWMWSAEDAARVMVQAVEDRRGVYTFTWHARFAAFMMRRLPHLSLFILGLPLRRRQRQISIEPSRSS
jgi:NAD(P)-dependent dehydrogenase (short-subunit alcohol dehydrogenase family)